MDTAVPAPLSGVVAANREQLGCPQRFPVRTPRASARSRVDARRLAPVIPLLILTDKYRYGTVREGEMSKEEPQKPDGIVTLGDVALHPCSIH